MTAGARDGWHASPHARTARMNPPYNFRNSEFEFEIELPLPQSISNRTYPKSPPLFDVIDRAWPILLQQPRERAVGEETAAGLTARAVVRLVVGVADALHGRAAHRTRLAEPAVHRHLRTERGDFFGETVADVGPQPVGPFAQHDARRIEQLIDLLLAELLRQRERGEPRAVQDLVGICVPDAVEQARIRERTLQRVVLRTEPVGKRGAIGAEHVEAAAIELLQTSLA